MEGWRGGLTLGPLLIWGVRIPWHIICMQNMPHLHTLSLLFSKVLVSSNKRNFTGSIWSSHIVIIFPFYFFILLLLWLISSYTYLVLSCYFSIFHANTQILILTLILQWIWNRCNLGRTILSLDTRSGAGSVVYNDQGRH